ncbi:hypothetical protein NIES4071_82570 [Calothrix sp. NIES-4071]|nr:hypothetical protein NIES4071_82570 [Calothrix sp. NIES-4071]BAZ62526.1 hypothetical protein NIES4105_82500 [Calothrix sp. NIES-4105]
MRLAQTGSYADTLNDSIVRLKIMVYSRRFSNYKIVKRTVVETLGCVGQYRLIYLFGKNNLSNDAIITDNKIIRFSMQKTTMKKPHL